MQIRTCKITVGTNPAVFPTNLYRSRTASTLTEWDYQGVAVVLSLGEPPCALAPPKPGQGRIPNRKAFLVNSLYL